MTAQPPRIRHLNCGTLHPPGAVMVCHVLLIETAHRLVLVDTGLGLADIANPRRIGPVRHLVRPALRESETALRQVAALGLDPADVSDVVLTHGDLDHAGGLADLPRARVHLLAAENAAIGRRRGLLESQRYPRAQWAHHPLVTGHPPGRARWKGFDEVVDLSDVVPGMLMVPLPGHTPGHAGVAVPTAEGWLLHAGDAFHSPQSLRGGGPRPDVRLRQAFLAHDIPALRRTQRRLAALAARDPSVEIVNGHDRAGFEAARSPRP